METGFSTRSVKTSEPATGREGPNLYRLSVQQYFQMMDAGIFKEGQRVELLGGLLIEKRTKYPPHNFGVGSFAEHLRNIVSPGWFVREEKALDLDPLSRPEPDIVVARGPQSLYSRRDPTVKDIALVIEVADSSYSEDRNRKWNLYAAAKVPIYIILNIPARRVELYRKPIGRGATARYRETEVFEESSDLPVVIEGVELGQIAVRGVLSRL